MGPKIIVATCSLNQWALDFEGNLERILESIRVAKQKGATLRVEDTDASIIFLKEILIYIPGKCLEKYCSLRRPIIFCSISECKHSSIDLPVAHKSVRYNCRIIVLNGKILLIRPKMFLANDGNYRELRYFVPWSPSQYVEEYRLPRIISDITGQATVPIGDAVVSTFDTCVGVELCEELFTPNSPHISMGLDGVEIFTNSSGSHHELRKLHRRIDLIKEATLKNGGVYLYANQQGCDGDRLYYDGCALIAVNGQIIVQGSQFSLRDVEVITAVVDIEDVRSHRVQSSRGMQAVITPSYRRIEAHIELSQEMDPKRFRPTKPVSEYYHTPEQEIALGPACWLWDYLRRSKTSGYFLPLSGGIDSCATATIVYSMCRLVVDAVAKQNAQVIEDARRIAGEEKDSDYIPTDPKEFANRVFHTCYMGTENSSKETRERAKNLANSIGSYHIDLNMDDVVTSVHALFNLVTKKIPKFRVNGGTEVENLALQNIQARLRMVLAYLFAQLLPWARNRSGALLVLGSSNVDECLRGYLTKYDCSSADLNPIGAISKTDLRKFIAYAKSEFDIPILDEFLNSVPTAELEPITSDYVQADEVDMGMTYDELSVFGRLRKIERCGPFSMFSKLVYEWGPALRPSEIASKVKRFFFYYSVNRHKMTTLTPSYHAETYSPDDNRFDLRPFLYNTAWSWQFKKVDSLAIDLEKGET
ncbi:8594_t:CDS:10 [Acaulospora morrowiae]|uniref:Glutamine-dependent NAD(+) synthetase n=1 Tax=Acaulospora morrowiae TaxID=94023 RepID=A0A9N9AAL2_9GLOM|nr:8594_t:CDS:10 [Acaulospora morrowiae]